MKYLLALKPGEARTFDIFVHRTFCHWSLFHEEKAAEWEAALVLFQELFAKAQHSEASGAFWGACRGLFRLMQACVAFQQRRSPGQPNHDQLASRRFLRSQLKMKPSCRSLDDQHGALGVT